jgi:hypothetical protein
MSGFTPSATFEDGRSLAGLHQARQKPDRKSGVLITRARDGFLALMKEYVKGEDGKMKSQKPVIKSEATWTQSPEVWDDEVLPHLFRQTSDVASVSVDASITVPMDITSGIEVGDLLLHAPQSIQMKVTAVASSNVTATVLHVEGGGTVTMQKSDSARNLEKLAPAKDDGFTVGTGVSRTKIQRVNYLQLMDKPVSIGIVAENLALQGGDSEGAGGERKRQIQMAMYDLLKQRDNQLIGSVVAKLENSGSSNQSGIAKGLLGWSGATVPNADPAGGLSFEDFVNVHMGAAREAGGSSEMYALAGLGVRTALNSYYQKQIRIVDGDPKYKAWVTRYETPAGYLNVCQSDFMDSETRYGQMITFDPDRLSRKYLRNLDFKHLDGLELNNIMGYRSAWLVMECLMAQGDHVRLHTNILKGA